jgi:hypothetical protein
MIVGASSALPGWKFWHHSNTLLRKRNCPLMQMEIVMRCLSLLAGLFAVGFAVSPALALSNRTFVSGIASSDAGACPVTAPCRTFAYAITQTSDGGEIAILSSAGYGSVNITQSVIISNPGGFEAAVSVNSGQSGITINAPSTANVTLRGLTLTGGGTATNGIVANSAASVNIIGCIVKDFVNNGIVIQPSAGAGTVLALVADTYVFNNGKGINVAPISGGIVSITINQVTAKDNVNGFYFDTTASGGRTNAVISGSHADYNTNNGITATANGNFNVYVNVKDSYATGNKNFGISAVNTGLGGSAGAGTGIVLNDVYAINNAVVDVNSSQSSIFSFGNNFWFSIEGTAPTTNSLR